VESNGGAFSAAAAARSPRRLLFPTHGRTIANSMAFGKRTAAAFAR
jgi:hypothetical protein